MRRALRVLACIALAASFPSLAGDFTYSIPSGWRDLRAAISAGPGDKDVSKVPLALTQDAGSGRFAMVAIDPKNTTYERAGATMNAVEMKGSGRLKLENVKEAANGLQQIFASKGLGAEILATEMIKLNGVDVGRTLLDATAPGQDARRVLQYIIPGQNSATVLSFSAPKEEFAAYRPVFEASANATRGGFNHGGMDWTRVLVSAGIAGLIGGAAALVFKLRRGRHEDDDAAPVPAAAARAAAPVSAKPATAARAAPAKTTKYTWMCTACGNPVPMRIDQCRCGAAKPA
jgi:hypothetical protein